jgi:hypothetical protein
MSYGRGCMLPDFMTWKRSRKMSLGPCNMFVECVHFAIVVVRNGIYLVEVL